MGEGFDVDLAVIGSGGAAMAAGITARQQGASVVLIESGTLGGTCVNVGCVPSKTLLAAATTRHAAQRNPFVGVPTWAGGVDFAALVAQKDDLVSQLRATKYVDVAAAHGFEIRRGEARFGDDETLLVDCEGLRARAYVVATGAEPAVSTLPGLEGIDYLTSTSAMAQKELPESLIVVGGGYVGMEQAQLFAHLGTKVTLVGRLAPRAEPELAELLRQVFDDDGITLIEEHADNVEHRDDAILVTSVSGEQADGQRLLVATGRQPRTASLNLIAAGVDCDAAGFITVDDTQRSSNPRVFAAGDVSGAPQFVYVAAATGRVAALNAVGVGRRQDARVDYTGLPSVTFTRPQLAAAGLTEAAAIEAGHRCECRVLGLHDVPRALANHDTHGAVKLVADAYTGKLLGVHAVAEGAGEIMLAATYAIRAGMTVDDLADTWSPYLTMAESLRIAAGLYRSLMPTSCCA